MTIKAAQSVRYYHSNVLAVRRLYSLAFIKSIRIWIHTLQFQHAQQLSESSELQNNNHKSALNEILKVNFYVENVEQYCNYIDITVSCTITSYEARNVYSIWNIISCVLLNISNTESWLAAVRLTRATRSRCSCDWLKLRARVSMHRFSCWQV